MEFIQTYGSPTLFFLIEPVCAYPPWEAAESCELAARANVTLSRMATSINAMIFFIICSSFFDFVGTAVGMVLHRFANGNISFLCFYILIIAHKPQKIKRIMQKNREFRQKHRLFYHDIYMRFEKNKSTSVRAFHKRDEPPVLPLYRHHLNQAEGQIFIGIFRGKMYGEDGICTFDAITERFHQTVFAHDR